MPSSNAMTPFTRTAGRPAQAAAAPDRSRDPDRAGSNTTTSATALARITPRSRRPKTVGGQARHRSNRVWQVDDVAVAHVDRELPRERAIAARVRLALPGAVSSPSEHVIVQGCRMMRTMSSSDMLNDTSAASRLLKQRDDQIDWRHRSGAWRCRPATDLQRVIGRVVRDDELLGAAASRDVLGDCGAQARPRRSPLTRSSIAGRPPASAQRGISAATMLVPLAS